MTPTLDGLAERFVTDWAETVAILCGLPETTLAHKARFHRIAQTVMYWPDHTREHADQIRRAFEAVRTPAPSQ